MTWFSRGTFAALLLGLTGCPDRPAGQSSPKPEACTTRGAQCRLDEGVLGVCNDAPCPAGKEPPCLKCISQH